MQKKAAYIALGCLAVAIIAVFCIGLTLADEPAPEPVPEQSSTADSTPHAMAEFDENGVIIRDDNLYKLYPYKDLSEDLVEQSSLGPADVIYADPVRSGVTYYYWFSDYDPDEIAWAVMCDSGRVVDTRVSVLTLGDWPDPFNLPEEQASTPKPSAPSRTNTDTPLDPYDYDDPEEYADDAAPWFAEHGYSSPWNAAYDYWEENY